jgi:hypothetical protein
LLVHHVVLEHELEASIVFKCSLGLLM